MFSLGPTNITKRLLLDLNPEEAYMSFYLGINPGPGLFKSPLRKDNNPTCSFYKGKSGLKFKDFDGSFNGDFVDVVMKIHNVSYNRALNIIANDFRIIDDSHFVRNEKKIEYDGSTVTENEGAIIQCELKDYDKKDLDFWNDFGITQKTLKHYGVFCIKSVFLNSNFHTSCTNLNPIYGYYFGKKDTVEQWKIYFPKRTSYRFLLNTNVIQGVKQLPKRGRFLVITKSLKDVMTLHELGIPAIAPQNENIILSNRQYDALANRFEYIIVNGDWDRAGRSFMQKSRKAFKCICLTFNDKSKYGKDLSDFVKMHGKEKAVDLVNIVSREIVDGKYDYQFDYSK